jgi:hypothetical protein
MSTETDEKPTNHNAINDDVFDYSNGFSQCISGFGRNAVEAIMEIIDRDRDDPDADPTEDAERIAWHVGELVRWCRGFNAELKRSRPVAAELLQAVESFLAAPRSEHLAVRLNDAEMLAVEAMRNAVAKARGT